MPLDYHDQHVRKNLFVSFGFVSYDFPVRQTITKVGPGSTSTRLSASNKANGCASRTATRFVIRPTKAARGEPHTFCEPPRLLATRRSIDAKAPQVCPAFVRGSPSSLHLAIRPTTPSSYPRRPHPTSRPRVKQELAECEQNTKRSVIFSRLHSLVHGSSRTPRVLRQCSGCLRLKSVRNSPGRSKS
jgi:hypothetical protein